MAQILLHETLHATIYEVDRIHGGFLKNFLHKVVAHAIGFNKTASRLYATIDLGKARVGRTRLLDEHSNPRWYESFHIYCAHVVSDAIFTVKVDNPIGAELIGRAYLPVEELLYEDEVDRWLPVLDEDRKPIHGHSKILVEIAILCQRKGCRVSLYQDAHIPNNFIPKIPLASGKFYEPNCCWEDVFNAITNAKHLIYITGWLVYTEITLVRDSRRPKPGGDMTLGELLKKKASEGVRVLMLVWNDRTSLMETHDEETLDYFQGTEVHCVLCPRNPDEGRSIFQDTEVGGTFTHHQKSVVVDAEMPNGNQDIRRIVSFVGGIDLCNGRYDT